MKKRILKSLVSILLVVGIMAGAVISVTADDQETYLSELRLIYADSYEEAKEILADTDFTDFQILNMDLNAGSGEIGVWLAYQTTSNVNEAITDIAVMQMGGGYSTGNYRELIKSARDEYQEMGEIYLQAIEYFMEAYDADSFLASAAYRQLNFYNGLDNYEDDRIGDLFVEGVMTSSDLATLFLQGNSYVLKNIRSLLAMGVSYNEDGMHYLEKVGEAAEEMSSDPHVFDGEDYDTLAAIIAPTIKAFGTMFEELSGYEDDLNYADENFTDLEVKYSEYKAMAELMRAVPYLGEKDLYSFCVSYTVNTDDYSSLYPLVAALNDGQVAMTTVSQYYDVVRYSMSELPMDVIDEEIGKLEETYGENPVDVYTGVDRSIYEDTFALTNRAVLANAYYDNNSLADVLLGNAGVMKAAGISSGALNVGLSAWTISNAASDAVSTSESAESTTKMITRYTNMFRQVTNAVGGQTVTFGPFIDSEIKKYTFYDLVYELLYNYDKNLPDQEWTFDKLYACFKHEIIGGGIARSEEAKLLLKMISSKMEYAESAIVQKPPVAAKTLFGLGINFTTLFYFLDASILAASAIALGIKVYDHYHPTYDDVPTSMVDLINTDAGDIYVKYNVVYEAKQQKDGEFSAGDLNAFEGQRWNALYYTKSDKAGKPLLADFTLSNDSNRPEEGYLAVHRFDEVICYDLNKYNFSPDSDNIFLSVAQSENVKETAEEAAPELVGSIFSSGFWFLAFGVGLVFGICGMLGAQTVSNKKKKQRCQENHSEG